MNIFIWVYMHIYVILHTQSVIVKRIFQRAECHTSVIEEDQFISSPALDRGLVNFSVTSKKWNYWSTEEDGNVISLILNLLGCDITWLWECSTPFPMVMILVRLPMLIFLGSIFKTLITNKIWVRCMHYSWKRYQIHVHVCLSLKKKG